MTERYILSRDIRDYSVIDTHNGDCVVLKTDSLSYALIMRNALNANNMGES